MARKSRTKIPSAKSARLSATNSRGGVEYRRLGLVVSRDDAIPATALLEQATGALSAQELVASLRRISVWVPRTDARRARTNLQAMLAEARKRGIINGAKVEEEPAQDAAWAHAWKRFYKPFEIARGLFIVPSWNKSFRPPRKAACLRLDPGMAFGTGQHPTTRLALALMLRYVRSGFKALDIGCGSGIIALAAALRGARIYASDMDPIAVAAASANFALNHLHARSIVRARDVPKTFPRADLITANITARVLERLASQLAGKLKPQGTLISSGLVDAGKDRVLRAFSRAGLEHIDTLRLGAWLAFAHVKKSRQ